MQVFADIFIKYNYVFKKQKHIFYIFYIVLMSGLRQDSGFLNLWLNLFCFIPHVM